MKSKCGAALLLMLVLVMACAGALAVEYTVSFDQNLAGVTVTGLPQDQTIAENNTVVQPPAPSAVGYTFGGWYKDVACTNGYVFTDQVTESFTLYAKWTLITHTVKFDLQDASITPTIPDQTVTYGATVTKPSRPTTDEKVGYTFGGWYKERTCATEFKFANDPTPDTVTKDITLYAKWSINQYTVTFHNNGHGVQPPAQKVNHGETAKNPGDLVEQGWKFVRWYYLDATSNTRKTYNFSRPVTGDINLYAGWIQQHTVTFNMNGHGKVIKPVTVDHGGTVSVPNPAPTAEGYAFGGWYQDANFKIPFDFDQKQIKKNTTIHAKWTANVKVKFQWQKAITHTGADPTGSAQVQLLGNGAAVSGANELTVQPNVEGEWTGLAADVKYSVKATNVPANYTAVCTQTGENAFLITYVENEKLKVTITNKHAADTIDMVISKFWDDNNNQHRPRSIQVQVMKVENGVKETVKDKNGNAIVRTLDESNQWTAHVTDLYMRENGKTIQYIIEEVGDVKGYKATCEIVVDAQGNYTVRVTNVLTGKVDISGKKIWDDDNDRDGIRPQSVQLKIYENSLSTLVKNVIVDANGSTGNEWTWTVEDLPVYDEFGSPITYIVVEDPVPAGYTASDPQYITVGTTGP